MAMRTLTLDDDARARAKLVIEHARLNPYRAGRRPPGNDERHVVKLDTFRAVFSFTDDEGILYRYLSVSVTGGKLPHPIAVFMIAAMLFEFTGYQMHDGERCPDDWFVGSEEIDTGGGRAALVVQPLATTVQRSSLN